MSNLHLAKASLTALGLALVATSGAQAQTTASASATVGAQTASVRAAKSPASSNLSSTAVANFSSTYGIQVVQQSTPMAQLPFDSAPPTMRLRALQRLAAQSNVAWRKVYRVSPATVAAPVTSYSAAQQMADQQGLISLDVSGIPADSAMRTIAAADNATVEFTGGAPAASINLDLLNNTVPQAISIIAARTHTHWQPVYMLAPVSSQTPTPSRVAFAAPAVMSQTGYEATQLFNGPLTIHVADVTPVEALAPPPVKSTVVPPVTDAANANGAAAQANAATAAANAAVAPVPTVGYGTPYGSMGYGYGYAPYGYGYTGGVVSPYPASSGVIVAPGYNSGGSVVFGGQTINPFAE